MTSTGLPTAVLQRSRWGCPLYPAFESPWARSNIALTYGMRIQDGLGSQTARIMGVYAVAAASGLPYHHTTLQCIGHIGGLPHYRDTPCDNLAPSDMARLRRLRRYISLPSSTPTNASAWQTKYMFRADWRRLAEVVAAAEAAQAPTLIQLELLDEFVGACPDIFYHVPQWQPPVCARARSARAAASAASEWQCLE